MRILVLFSNPPSQSRLRLDREDREISRLERASSGSAEFTRQHASHIDDIHDLIVDKDYDIIHFSGHGSPEGIYLDRSDMSEKGELVSSERLVKLLDLAGKAPSVALFLCCYTDSNLGILANVAPFVITSKYSVPDEACIQFTRGFYEAILHGRPVQASYEHACKVVAVSGFSAEFFNLSRRSVVLNDGSVFLESNPDLNRDSILVNLDEVEDRIGKFGMPEETLLHMLARKLTIHCWIFDCARDRAIIPIGKLLFGEFSWKNAKDVVYCTKLVKLSSDIPSEHWELWSRLLTSYNDLASCEYRSLDDPANPVNRRFLHDAAKLWRVYVLRHLRPAIAQFEKLGFANLIPHVSFGISQSENAMDQLELERYPQAVQALEQALSNYHEVVDGLQPPEEAIQ